MCHDLDLTKFNYAGADLRRFQSGDIIYGGRDVEDIKRRRYDRLTGKRPWRLGPLSTSIDVFLQNISNLSQSEVNHILSNGTLPPSLEKRLLRELEKVATPIEKAQMGAYLFTGRRIAQGIKAATGNTYTLKPQAQYFMDWLQRNGARRITSISGTLRNTIKDILIDKSFVDIQSREVIMRLIEKRIPLTRGHSRAVQRFYRREESNFLAQGNSLKDSQRLASEKAGQYAKRLRRWRAWNIARTELSQAWAYSSLETMKDAQNKELFGPNRRLAKLWLTGRDERVCSICGPLDGTTVPLEGTFDVVQPTSKGDKLVPNLLEGKVGETAYVYAHMSCRCDAVYVLE